MAAQQSARELARLGRVEQLKALADFERGRDVTFKLHNNPKGFPLNKNKVGFVYIHVYISSSSFCFFSFSHLFFLRFFSLQKVKPVPRTETRVKFTPWDRLVEATVGGNFEEVERLIKAGVNVNSRDADGMTALHRSGRRKPQPSTYSAPSFLAMGLHLSFLFSNPKLSAPATILRTENNMSQNFQLH